MAVLVISLRLCSVIIASRTCFLNFFLQLLSVVSFNIGTKPTTIPIVPPTIKGAAPAMNEIISVLIFIFNA